MLEKNGLRIAAISYDSPEILRGFADAHGIGFPLLSDGGSAVIRRFGIFNTNIAPGLRAHGVPHPVEYLVAPDGTVIRKYFVANYQHRVTASAVVLREFGVVGENASRITLKSGALTVELLVPDAKIFAGHEISFLAKFTIEPGWHVYTPTSITFDDPRIIGQSFELPPLQMYRGSFQALGSLLLKFPIDPGPIALSGQLQFQQCSDTTCEPPETIPFELPLTIAVFMDPDPKK